MGKIVLVTEIGAPIDRVFDLARSIDLHTKTASETNERAIVDKNANLGHPIETLCSMVWRIITMFQRLSYMTNILAVVTRWRFIVNCNKTNGIIQPYLLHLELHIGAILGQDLDWV